MKLHAARCGHVSVDEGILEGGGLRGANRLVPSMVFVVDHPEGILLWDTSMNPKVCNDAVGYWGPLAESISVPHYSPEEVTTARLAELGIAAEAVRFVVNSHLHNDHCGSNRCFPGATVVFRRDEYAHAVSATSNEWSGFVADDFLGDDVDFELVDYADHYDLFGDSSLVLLSTVGHTTGHQSLQVTFPSGRRFVLTGDAVYTADQLANGKPPGLTADAAEATRSSARLRSLEEAGATVLIAHEPAHWTQVQTTATLHTEA
jgi:glyoxylase-like metal-dependent hydrolase (beta-lactamase superfamily II)